MEVKIFSASHVLPHAEESTLYLEGKRDGRQFWFLAKLPLQDGAARELQAPLRRILEQHYLHTEENHDDAVESSIKALNDFLAAQIPAEEREHIFRMGAILVAFLEETQLLLSTFGEAEAFLLRDAALMEISDGLAPKKVESDFFENVSSGDLGGSDRLIFSTVRLQRTMTERQIGVFLKDGVMEAKESIASFLETEESGGFLIFHIKDTSTQSFLEPKASAERAFAPRWQDDLKRFWKDLTDKLPFELQRAHLLLAGAAVLALFLLFLLMNSFSDATTEEQRSQFDAFLGGEVETQFQTAESAYTIGDVARANKILDEIDATAEQMLVAREYINNAQAIRDEVKDRRKQYNNITTIENPDVLADFSTMNPDIQTKGLTAFDGGYYVFDRDTLYRVLLGGEAPTDLGPLTSSETLRFGVSFETQDGLLFVTDQGSVLEWQDGQVSSIDTADETWRTPMAIDVYSKYLYFLSPEDGQVWKYERRDTAFTTSSPWITGEIDGSNVVSFTVDGNIFLLEGNGNIRKFYLGAEQNYTVKGVPSATYNATKIFTTPELDKLFVLDTNENRIFLLFKGDNEAEYIRQIALEGLSSPIVDFYPTEDKILVLTEQKLYNIPL